MSRDDRDTGEPLDLGEPEIVGGRDIGGGFRVVHEGDHVCLLPDPNHFAPRTVVECRCGRQWRAHHPGNPTYSTWRRVQPLRRDPLFVVLAIMLAALAAAAAIAVVFG